MLDPTGYPLGVPVMDYQHQRLLVLINQLTAKSTGLAELIAAFNTYADQHFLLEEALMDAHAYGDRDAHVAAHDAYRARFRGLVAEAVTPEAVQAMQLFLERWWVEHIGGVDTKLADFLRAP